ncbi:MAG TPA: hypothetical protein DD633_05840 [Sphaerochaeta sp.]|nr:hypothetical protein [Sphaerochaeta sp.]
MTKSSHGSQKRIRVKFPKLGQLTITIRRHFLQDRSNFEKMTQDKKVLGNFDSVVLPALVLSYQ